MVRLKLAILLLILLAPSAYGKPNIYKLDVNFQRIIHNADPMAYEIDHTDWTTAWQMETGVEVGRYFLEPQFHFESAYSKVTSVGLYFKQGFRLFDWLDLAHTHHSRHLADRKPLNYSERKYPLFDAVELNFHFVPGNVRGRR